MPWIVRKRNKKFMVFKQGPDGEPVGDALGQHDTEAEAQAQQRALYASESSKLAVKFANPEETELEGLLAPYGGVFEGRDVSGEFFSVKTDFVLDWFPADRPLLYHHGLDPKTGPSVVGRIKAVSRDELGLWMRAQLDASHDYFAAIRDLVKAGKLGLSSGSMRHLVKVDHKSGEILRWPLIEGSLTPTPCNPLAEVEFTAVKSHMEAIGTDLPEGLKAEMSKMRIMMAEMAKEMDMEMSEAEMDNMMASMDKDMPEDEMRAEMRKEMQECKDKSAHKTMQASDDTAGGYLTDRDEHAKPVQKEPAPTKMAIGDVRKIMTEMSAEMGLKVSDDEMTEMMAGMEDMAEPEMRAAMRKKLQAHKDKMASEHKSAEIVAAPRQTAQWLADLCDAILEDDPDTRKAFDALPLTTHAETTAKYALALQERTQDLRERRIKEGRIISMANRKRLSDCVASMRQACEDLQGLLDSTDKPEAKATDWTIWRHWLAIQKESQPLA